MNWSAADFILFGLMLATAGGGFMLALRAQRSRSYRAAAGLALLTAFVLVWANAAVGVIGSEDHPVNLAYFGVLAIGLVGGLIARFRPLGLARALVAMAIAQAAVMGYAWAFQVAGGLGPSTVGTAVFVALWLGSAALFRRAARQERGN